MKPIGKVFLIGAGPGDAELLTLKAVRGIEAADVILVDELVSSEILALASERAEIIHVRRHAENGIASPDAMTQQEWIHKSLIDHARSGKNVVRLKGGDPFIFGRGGEEVEALTAAGIQSEVVSGVTAGIAIPASLGIPLTHRDLSGGVTFLTGHSCQSREQNWRALVQSETTLVIYMGVANLPTIAAALMENGMAENEPVALIEKGTLPTERVLIAQLSTIVAESNSAKIESPALIVIGKVVAMFKPSNNISKSEPNNLRRNDLMVSAPGNGGKQK